MTLVKILISIESLAKFYMELPEYERDSIRQNLSLKELGELYSILPSQDVPVEKIEETPELKEEMDSAILDEHRTLESIGVYDSNFNTNTID